MTRKFSLSLTSVAVLGSSSLLPAQELPVSPTGELQRGVVLKADLTPLVSPPASWSITTDGFEEMFLDEDGEALFEWLTSDKSRGRISRHLYSNVETDLTLFDGETPVEEIIVDFANGRLDLVTLSLFNRGDAAKITADEFDARFQSVGKHVGQALGVRPRRREAKAERGLLTEGFAWKSPSGHALLEHNEGAQDGEKEFLRLRISHPDSESALARAMQHERGGASVTVGELPKRVVRGDNGDVYIGSVPMVDQGNKGYCVCATVERVFEYYGIGVDMHQIAEIADADPERGTSSIEMSEQLNKIDYRFKTRLKVIALLFTDNRLYSIKAGRDMRPGRAYEVDDFENELKRSIDRGVPILWAMTVGERDEVPPIPEGQGGPHMRLLIGYNEEADTVIFSDSWGAGHEKKTMALGDAFYVTHGLFSLSPTVR